MRLGVYALVEQFVRLHYLEEIHVRKYRLSPFSSLAEGITG
jgi:hypothetical protein